MLLENKLFEIDFILDYQCSEQTLVDRIMFRAKTSGRSDDNMEVLTNRIKNFLESTGPTLALYNTFGKVHPIDASGGIAQIQQATKDALLPNLCFIYGPPVSVQCKLAKFLQNRTQHKLLDLESFYKSNKLSDASCDKKANFLINHLQCHAEHNFILNGFPQTRRQLNIFLDYFAAPSAVFYLEASKDFVEHNIKTTIKSAKGKKLAHAKFEHFLNEKQSILSVLRKQSKFINVDLNAGKCFKSMIIDNLKPEVIFALPGINPELCQKLIGNLKTERGYIHLDMDYIKDCAVKRGTEMGQRF